MKGLKEEFDRVRKDLHEDASRVDELRSIDSFDRFVLKYPFGDRVSLRPKVGVSYEDLQCTRGLDLALDLSPEKLFENSLEPINAIDNLRFEELKEFNGSLNPSVFDANGGMFEIGFRSAKLLKFYSDKFASVGGCDVVAHNVNVAKVGGFDAHQVDMNSPGELVDLLSRVNLVVSYQVFEHLYDPLSSLKKLYEAMKPGSYLHIEVPTEIGLPRIRYAHVYAFHPNDLKKMLDLCGFSVLHSTTKKLSNQPELQRCLAFKPTT